LSNSRKLKSTSVPKILWIVSIIFSFVISILLNKKRATNNQELAVLKKQMWKNFHRFVILAYSSKGQFCSFPQN
jgi:hypothetical protein